MAFCNGGEDVSDLCNKRSNLVLGETTMVNDHEEEILLFSEMSKGSMTAFDELYARYSEAVYYTIYKKIKNKDEVDDVFQDFFASIWRKKENISVNTSFKAFLFTSLRNHILNHLLQTNNREKRALDYTKSLSHEDTDLARETDIIGISKLVTSEINRLPEKMHRIWRLRKEDGLSISEISSQLNISEQTVKNQLSTANRRLRLFLEKLHTFLFFL